MKGFAVVVPDGWGVGGGFFYPPGTWTVLDRGKVRMPPAGVSRGIQLGFDDLICINEKDFESDLD